MSTLFASRKRKPVDVVKVSQENNEAEEIDTQKQNLKRRRKTEKEEDTPVPVAEEGSQSSSASETESSESEDEQEREPEKSISSTTVRTFSELGLSAWLVNACAGVGIRQPTAVQANCIPEILAGRDVIGCAQTGSGKTAAFGLPILEKLAEDPYGPFALVLTPTRELAVQIGEQFSAFGARMNLRTAIILGGMDMMAQSLELSRRPHVIIATPGRLRDHLQGASPPDLTKIAFLVLDEADRLLEPGFSKDLAVILDPLPENRQTLVFSATMTKSIKKLQSLSMNHPFRFDATPKATTVESLFQQYLLLPKQTKPCYLAYVCSSYGPKASETDSESEEEEEEVGVGARGRASERATSMIIFVSTCKMCQILSETLNELQMPSVALHSMMSQNRRLAALGKFKSAQVKTLVCTDVASRGLDIPQVDLVINYDVPLLAKDYIHRVGRTARAGRGGRAITFVSQYDVELVKHIEEYLGKEMSSLDLSRREEEVLKMMTPTATAMRMAKLRLVEVGFEDKVNAIKSRNQRQRQEKAKQAEKETDQKTKKKKRSSSKVGKEEK